MKNKNCDSSKIVEKKLKRKMQKLQKRQKMNSDELKNEQGFRKGKSCMDNVSILITKIEEAFHKKKLISRVPRCSRRV